MKYPGEQHRDDKRHGSCGQGARNLKETQMDGGCAVNGRRVILFMFRHESLSPNLISTKSLNFDRDPEEPESAG